MVQLGLATEAKDNTVTSNTEQVPARLVFRWVIVGAAQTERC